LAVAQATLHAKVFLHGPAGAGKTTAAVQRLLHLLQAGLPASAILVLAPQRTLTAPYADALRSHRPRGATAAVPLLTAGGLAQRMVELYWPLVAEQAGFAQPDRAPTFLTLETAQYVMARLVRPLLEEGLFQSLTIDRNRLYSQIIDNLNKAAVVGFPHTEIGQRLQAAAMGEPAQANVFADAQRCASLFRQHCLAHNLLDFSLQVEVFWQHVWPLAECRRHLTATYHHLIYDNIEEDTPFAHDLVRDWLPAFDSALLIYDHDAGYRQFLGADPQSGLALSELCTEQIAFEDTFVPAPPLQALGEQLGTVITHNTLPGNLAPDPALRDVLAFEYQRYYPQMLDWVAGEVANLVHQAGVPPREIAVLAPFLSDALRFSLMNRLERLSVPVRSHRPSRALREEPATDCLLTLAALAHPQWGIHPTKYDFAYTLMQAIAGMDLVRAQLLAEIVFRSKDSAPALTSFDQINPDMHERITYVLGGRYEGLRIWLADAVQRSDDRLDHFLARLFGEVLSQPGYGFHANYDAAEVAANLVESVQNFRWVAEASLAALGPSGQLGREYLEMVRAGVIAAQYVRSWKLAAAERDNAVLLAPAHTFLMGNRPVSYQFWLDVGSRGWFERLLQPLTHPYVLSRQWQAGQTWTDSEEFAASEERMRRLAVGLIRRCRQGIYLGLSELSEQGYELRGPLLMALHTLWQRLPAPEETAVD
jgi:hypothetical protein